MVIKDLIDSGEPYLTNAEKPASSIRLDFSENPNDVFADVARTFELRHIICHEIASAYEIKLEEVARCFESCVAFLRASDEFISETLYPGAPLTQTDMNIAAGETEALLSR